MAKIHIRGGSRLRLKFEGDGGAPLSVQLIKMGAAGWYRVRDLGTDKDVEAIKGNRDCVFRTSGPGRKTVVVDYKVP